ncbi:GNAT family N-acetyltransferase [Fulvivirga lutea]|uniref:GNAT family N-acetyltransferase n=1 Tax=Fulvivirga lutea TaxID=2810512 RepID=A0A974WDB2_9BACT|nr:GNAT family N-acetyltransferase [Fulvivirga lutea]QSE95848.1 GNAT family N-acetyltransferase [Fulvivirga lutea]
MLNTQNLTLRKISFDDALFIQKLVNSAGWLQHIGNRNVHDIHSAKTFIQSWAIERYEKYGFGPYLVVLNKTKEPIGVCGLFTRDYLDAPDIGFAILPEYMGKGFSYEASVAVIQQAKKLNLKTVYAITSTNNLASQKLIKKLGFGTSTQKIPTKDLLFELQLTDS